MTWEESMSYIDGVKHGEPSFWFILSMQVELLHLYTGHKPVQAV